MEIIGLYEPYDGRYDWWEMYECDTCKNGYLSLTKDMTPGCKSKSLSSCNNCNSRKLGKLLESGEGIDSVPFEAINKHFPKTN